jgi:condensin complex subunit 2
LNDDRQEKANRLNQIRASGTPGRHRVSLGAQQSPHTPLIDQDGMPDVVGTAVTPMKRVPLLANFEEWMKLATDNVRCKAAHSVLALSNT